MPAASVAVRGWCRANVTMREPTPFLLVVITADNHIAGRARLTDALAAPQVAGLGEVATLINRV